MKYDINIIYLLFFLFSVEDLEWEFDDEDARKSLKFSNSNKTVKNVGENSELIKLKNKTINNDKEYNITIKNEIKDDDWLTIGVCDRDWRKAIYYYHEDGNIYDNGRKIKRLEYKLKVRDVIKIKDTFHGKINDKKVFMLSIHKNQEKVFVTFYCAEERRTLLLRIGANIQVDVDVKGNILTNYWQYQNYLILILCESINFCVTIHIDSQQILKWPQKMYYPLIISTRRTRLHQRMRLY